jgi:hypothetical protein
MNNKKIFGLVLILIFCLTAASCSSKGINTNNDGKTDVGAADNITETTGESYYDTLGGRDFGGAVFTILDANDHPDFFINYPEEEMNGDPINDALYTRDRFIEEKYGVDIEYIQILWGNAGCAALEKSVFAGENAYDLLVSSVLGSALDKISTNNVLYNLIDAPYLSLKSPWWSRLLYDNIQFNGKLYYTGGDIFLPSYSQAPAAMVFNKKLLKDYGIGEDLYSLVFEGKWTLDVLEKLTKDMNKDLNQDGKMIAADDFYGLIFQWNTVTTGFWAAGLGIKFSSVSDNTISVDLDSADNLTKIDRLTNMLEKVEYADQMDIIDKTFKGGQALFLAHCMNTPQIFLRDMEDDYGILPMPKYDEKQESYVSFMNAWCSGYIGIPKNADIEKSAFITEAMGYAGYEMLRRPVYDITLKAKGARDEESEKIIDIIIETSYMDINSVYNFGGSCDIVRDTVMDKKPFVSAYEKKEPAMQNAVDKFIEAMASEK